MNQPTLDRREFVVAGTSLTVAASGRFPTPQSLQRGPADGEPIGLGVIGVGNRGMQVTRAFLAHPEVELRVICDVSQSQLDAAAPNLPAGVDAVRDFRELLARPDIHAVLIATPDHWHAIQTIQACRAGKDVYVEKPLSATIHEGRRMVEVARETERVVQVGTHRRSSARWQKMVELIQSGILGKVTMCHAYRINNMAPDGIGRLAPTPPPAGLDWDMWLGPRAAREYRANITPYKFRWWQDFSSQFGNWGVHYFDVMRWALNERAPCSICAMGGNFAIEDDRTIPDTAQAIYQFPSGVLALFGTYEAFGNPLLRSGEFEVRGTQGTLWLDGDGIHVRPERRGQFQTDTPPGAAIDIELKSSNHDDTVAHTRNFLDCIRSRQRPHADIEIGHRSTTMSLLANISLATGQRLEWDAEQERCQSPAAANEWLHYEYRPPWTLDADA